MSGRSGANDDPDWAPSLPSIWDVEEDAFQEADPFAPPIPLAGPRGMEQGRGPGRAGAGRNIMRNWAGISANVWELKLMLRHKNTRRTDNGVALFVAIWILLVVSLLTIGVTRETRTVARLAGNEVQGLHARVAAEAGISWLQAALAAQAGGETLVQPPMFARGSGMPLLNTNRGIRLDGTPALWRFGELDVVLSAEFERGKLDLNRADPVVLLSVLERLVPTEADILATEILRARATGGRVSWRAGGERIPDVESLARFRGVSSEVFDKLAPLVTIYGTDRPDPLYAPDALYEVLPLERDLRVRLDAARRGKPADLPWPRRATVLTLRAEAGGRGGALRTLMATVEISPSAVEPIRVLRAPGQRYY